MTKPRLILASSSKSRAAVLSQAGIEFIQQPSSIDEAPVKATMAASRATAAQCAIRLAEMKARGVSINYSDAYVIGCDQMLDCQGQWFDKPVNIAAARTQLLSLRGKTHTLFNGMVVVRAGQTIWDYTNQADLEMRAFSDVFLDEYLTKVGDDALWTVGGYQLEGAGAQLFSSIQGDFFSILGLPLLPLLGFLREHGLITT